MEVEWRADTSPFALCKRAVSTLLLARRIHKNVKALEKKLEDDSDLDDDEKEEQWEQLHRLNAQATYRHIIKYKGFLAKVGQGMSARDGGIPQPYRDEFRALQDHLPVSPEEEIRQTLHAELGRKLEDVYDDFRPQPLASATVAQAHVAHLRSNGQKVCVKVQHAGVGRMMAVDLGCVEYIAKKAIQSHKEAPDITPLIREWQRASRDEVDFRLEARNMQRAATALKTHGVDVKCPVPVDGLWTERVLTMEFIEGWKVTDTERMPEGTDVAAFAMKLLDAFAVLVFNEGLIHGDPHPGNIFAAQSEDGSVHPVLLDWGLAKELTQEERFHTARWVIASMSQDRMMFMSAGQALGYKLTEHFETEALEDWMTGSLFLFRDSLPGSAQAYLFEMLDQWGTDAQKAEEEKQKLEKEEREKKENESNRSRSCWSRSRKKKKKDEPKKVVESIPGVLLFLTRAMSMLHGLCSSLNVSVPFAEPMVRRAMPILLGGQIPRPLTEATQGRTKLETMLLTKLGELQTAGRLVGAQIAVLSDGKQPLSSWLCDLAFGSMGFSLNPVTDATLMPLLDVGIGVLTLCLLTALARPSSTGKKVGLDTQLWEIWPEFSQKGKRGVTVRQLLHHRACLPAPFQEQKMSVKRFCTEKRMEESISAAPQEEKGAESAPCPVLGTAIAALLRRFKGSPTAAQALKGVLEPAGLHDDVAWHGDEARMAWVVRKPIEDLPLSRVFQWVEQQTDKLNGSSPEPLKAKQSSKSRWLTWPELKSGFPGCTDPLLPNRPELRAGEACATGRSLRATAKAICKLYASSATLPMLADSVMEGHRLQVDSLEEWERTGRCLDMGVGCQLFRFKNCRGDAAKDVVGYGFADGATGSVAMRLPNLPDSPGVSIAILLNNVAAVNQDNHYAGFELLEVIAAHFGLEPVWHKQVPNVPAKSPLRQAQTKEKDEKLELQAALARMEDRLAQITAELKLLQSGNASALGDHADAMGLELAGSWKSAEIDGLEHLLEVFQVPEAFHFFAKQATRTLCIELQGDHLTAATSTILAGRTVEELTLTFKPDGTPFQGEQQLGGSFRGVARWELSDAADGEPLNTLVLEKRFQVDGHELTVEERMTVSVDDRLMMVIRCDGLAKLGLAKDAGPIESTIFFNRQGQKLAPSHRKARATDRGLHSGASQVVANKNSHTELRESSGGSLSGLAHCLYGGLLGCFACTNKAVALGDPKPIKYTETSI